MDSNDIVDIIVLMSKDFLLFVQICLSRRGMTVLGQGGVPLQVVHVGRRMHYALLLVEVDGEWGARDFVLLILRGIDVIDRSILDDGPDTVPVRPALSGAGVSGAAWISSRLSVSGGV